MIKVLNTFKPQDTVKYYNGCNLEKYAEDLYYVVGMIKLNLNVGIDRFAINFCSHIKYFKNTFAVHKLYNYVNKNELNTFLKYCPEFEKFIKLKYIK